MKLMEEFGSTQRVSGRTAAEILPRYAGLAKLQWVDNDRTEPTRQGEVINLPLAQNSEFRSLRQGWQFVYVLKQGISGPRVFFGGTDERPFLVELTPASIAVVNAIAQQGEDWFFHQLKPRRVRLLEEALEKKAKRQGDIFAVPLAADWREINRIVLICGQQRLPQQIGEITLFRTRHTLTGTHIWVSNTEIWGTGQLQAPDHSSLNLDNPHALIQVEILRSPQVAD